MTASRKAEKLGHPSRTGSKRADPKEETRPKKLGFVAYTLRDVMSTDVVSVGPTASLEEAAGRMSRKNVSGLPVVDEHGKLVGVLSQKDVVRVLHEKADLTLPGGIFDLVLDSEKARRADFPGQCREVLRATRVSDAMSRNPIWLESEASIDSGIKELIANGINRVPVLHRGKLVGIVTRHDLLRAASSVE
jgi:CBS domain-containing protein